MSYRSGNELNYFGSDLNKFISTLDKKQTCINIDCLQFKRSKKILRIIESKHLNEGMPYSELEALKLLDSFLLNNSDVKANVYIFRGDPPYNYAEITRIRDNKKIILKNEQVKNWLEFNKG